MKPRTFIILIFTALASLAITDAILQADPPTPGQERNQAERDLRDSYESERAAAQASDNLVDRQGALVQRRIMDLQVSMREYRQMIEGLMPAPRTGRLYLRPEFGLVGGNATIQYLYPGNLAGLYKADRSRLEDLHGPVGPMRELVARRSTPEYQINLAALVEQAADNNRIIVWNVEPIPTGRNDWSAEDRVEWIAGHLLLIEDARAIDPDVKQAIYRVPYFDLVRESRIIYARDGAAGGSLAADAGLNASYWRDPARLVQEQAMFAAYAANRDYFTPLEAAVDFACVHGYQQGNYPPRVWAATEFARADATGKPILLWVSPRDRGRSDTAWADADDLRYMVALATRYDASAVLWINGADMADQSPEMADRLDVLRATFEEND